MAQNKITELQNTWLIDYLHNAILLIICPGQLGFWSRTDHNLDKYSSEFAIQNWNRDCACGNSFRKKFTIEISSDMQMKSVAVDSN